MHFCQDELMAIMAAFPVVLLAYRAVKLWVSAILQRMTSRLLPLPEAPQEVEAPKEKCECHHDHTGAYRDPVRMRTPSRWEKFLSFFWSVVRGG